MQGYSDSIDIQFSSSNDEVAEQLQLELEIALEQTYYSEGSPDEPQPRSSVGSTFKNSVQPSNRRILKDLEDSNPFYWPSYGIVTDTVSLLPYVGIWDVADYNGVNRVIGPDGKIVIFPPFWSCPQNYNLSGEKIYYKN